ncbi:MAG: hypothetical protein Q8P31_12510 [Bacillota bacterium]|nr:hypothetical protein [Bacillota bacterium]
MSGVLVPVLGARRVSAATELEEDTAGVVDISFLGLVSWVAAGPVKVRFGDS